MARDDVLDFGTISAATKDVEAFSSETLDFGPLGDRYPYTTHRTGVQEELSLVFNTPSDLASIDYIDLPKLVHSDEGESGFTPLVTGEACAAGRKAGKFCVMPFPKKHKRYVKAAATPRSSGVFTAIPVQVYVQRGPEILD